MRYFNFLFLYKIWCVFYACGISQFRQDTFTGSCRWYLNFLKFIVERGHLFT